jgi:hypothetical protein
MNMSTGSPTVASAAPPKRKRGGEDENLIQPAGSRRRITKRTLADHDWTDENAKKRRKRK